MICEKEVLLLIAYGNPLRRDDGAGLALAAQLAACWQAQGVHVRHLAVHQLTPELALELSSPDVQNVIFVDTTTDAAATIGMKPIRPTILGRVLGHHVTPDALLLYAQRLYGQHPPTWLLTIPGADFGFGEGFSTETMCHLATAERLAAPLLSTIGCAPGNDGEASNRSDSIIAIP
jgi:hydrogenase maturation protease